MRRWVRAVLVGALLPAAGNPARSQAPPATAPADSTVEQRVREIASLLRCPVCLNLSIQDSPSELARDMRDLVRERVKRGETRDQVLRYFIQRYGEWVLMRPPTHGVSLLVWLLPGVAVIGGGALVVLAVQRWIRNSANATGQTEDVTEADLRHVREELARGPRD